MRWGASREPLGLYQLSLSAISVTHLALYDAASCVSAGQAGVGWATSATLGPSSLSSAAAVCFMAAVAAGGLRAVPSWLCRPRSSSPLPFRRPLPPPSSIACAPRPRPSPLATGPPPPRVPIPTRAHPSHTNNTTLTTNKTHLLHPPDTLRALSLRALRPRTPPPKKAHPPTTAVQLAGIINHPSRYNNTQPHNTSPIPQYKKVYPCSTPTTPSSDHMKQKMKPTHHRGLRWRLYLTSSDPSVRSQQSARPGQHQPPASQGWLAGHATQRLALTLPAYHGAKEKQETKAQRKRGRTKAASARAARRSAGGAVRKGLCSKFVFAIKGQGCMHCVLSDMQANKSGRRANK
ncbi:merozoite surface protein CMZ-8-like [Penaeus chinensis]|uniref:merozoite surface protein CMZ-8-like n=1 Tax=Penaeus chinensis TaxID=139456 RepID=UPI001FB75856|nr:merozoite surface protein CMZ-8-like [Penaeus chinensis]